MAITRSQIMTLTPTALAGVDAGTWLLRRVGPWYITYFAVATSVPDADATAKMRIFDEQRVVVENGEALYVWQSGPKPGEFSYAGGYGTVVYQKEA